MKRILASILGLVGLLTAPAAFAQTGPKTPFTQSQYYASDYNQWAIASQSANTYLFSPGGLCQGSASGGQFFVFNTNAPVLIVDASPANSEVVTPSTATNTQSQCGFTASPSNNHFSFQVKSGSAGLQEALNALSNNPQQTFPALVILDRNFYIAASSIPGKTANGIINAAAGSASVILEDITSAPAKYYAWDGSKYSSSLSGAAFFNQKVTSYTALSAPTALSTAAASAGLITTATTGGTIPASSTYRLAVTYVDASGGETLISTDSASTSTIATGSGTATNTLTVTSPAASTGAVGYRLYVSAASGAAGSEILYTPTCGSTILQNVLGSVCAIGSNAVVTAIVTSTATVPVTGTAYPRTSGSNYSFPPFTALTTVNAAATGTLAVINFPAGYLNTLGRSFEICGNGSATTNGTGGTFTLAQKLFSVPGVTSITPWTAVSGTIAASALTVPFNFCVTYTTAATGATGTLETHGWVSYGLAGTAVGTVSQDTIVAVSSTVDLTKQDQLDFTVSPTTAGLTAAQLRQLTIYPIN
jgi:hypothetical protein